MAEYIEREAVIKCCTFGRTSLGLVNELRRLPAAEVQPVRHGRWILESTHEGLEDDPEQYWECSLCGCGSDSFDTVYHTPYCPNCGAKMDGENG